MRKTNFFRGKAAGIAALVGAAALAYGLLSPAGQARVPGWEPVNDRVIAALDEAMGPSPADASGAAADDPARPSAAKGEAASASPNAADGKAAAAPASAPAPSTAPDRASGEAGAPPAAALPSTPSAAASSPSAAASPPPAAASGLLNLNTATVEQLDALKGIGPSKARAIVEYREQHGPFRSVDDLLNVKGIGEKLLAGIRNDVTV